MTKKIILHEAPPFSLPAILPFAFPGLGHIHCLFTTALAGNLSLAAAAEYEKETVVATKKAMMIQFDFDDWVEVHQVHGDNIIEAPQNCSLETIPTEPSDGLYTKRKRCALSIRTADCQPLLITDVRGSFIAAIHVGWRGNAIKYPATAVKKLCEVYKVEPSSLMAVRGPSLGPGAAQFINFEKEWPADFSHWFDQKSRTMNLWKLTKDQLQTSGLLPGNIFSFDMCTYSLSHLFFSYRQKHAGRQASLIWIA